MVIVIWFIVILYMLVIVGQVRTSREFLVAEISRAEEPDAVLPASVNPYYMTNYS